MQNNTSNNSSKTQGQDTKNLVESKELNQSAANLDNPKIWVNHISQIATYKDGFDEQIEKLRVLPTENIPPPQTAWKQVLEAKDAILGTLGNISLVIGKAKSRKSFFINIAISTVLKNDYILNQFRGCLPHDKRVVLYFDTEQSRYHVQLALKRICRQIKVDVPDDLHVYGLRTLNPGERLNTIEHVIYKTECVGFVVIDGIKDLINSINDEGESTMIASKLLKWSEEREIHIVSVLHQNKSDNNARGHIGTELINKSETVLSVTKNEEDKDISVVEAQYCRNIEPEPFAFEIIDGLPALVENYEFRTESNKNKIDLTELNDHEVYELLNIVYSKNAEYGYSELVRQLKLAFKEKFNKKVGDNKVKELLSHCKNKKWVVQDQAKAPYKQGQFNEVQ